MPVSRNVRWVRLLALSVCAALVGCASLITPNVKTELAQLREGEYRLDPAHTTVLFKVSHLGLSTYVGRFNEFDASLDFDPNNLAAARLDGVVKTASIDVNNPTFENDLRGRGWFNCEAYPEARFRTTGVELTGKNRARFDGELNFLGVTAPLALDVTFHGGADNVLTLRYTLGFSASARFKRSDFGLDKYIPAVGDEVELEIHAEFQRLKR